MYLIFNTFLFHLKFGSPTILVNNAAIVRGKTILDESIRDITE